MRHSTAVLRALVIAVLAAGTAVTATCVRAQEADAAAAPQDSKPARAARLTFARGAVTVEIPQVPGPQPAQTNLPLLSGVHLSTGDDGQAEVEFEDGSVVRLTPNSTLSLDSLATSGDGVFSTAMTLLRGLAYAELRASAQYHYTLAAGGDVMSPVENATVRVNFDQPPAKFAVMDGSAEISHGGAVVQAHAGETLASEEDTPGQYSVTGRVANESWDAWNTDRDHVESAEAADGTDVRNGYAGAQGYGWADLDANGTWYDVPGQGQVWQPQVAVDDAEFDPYGYGAWAWYPSTGYVWASGYPWGWTPYRCGGWNYFSGFGWGWSPAGGCGAAGWTFWGVGRPVNIVYGPSGYRVPVVPRPRPGPVHPILPTRLDPGRQTVALGGQTGWGTLVQRGPRQIGGTVVMPVERHGVVAGFRRSGAAVLGPAALARDYPLDRNSHVAVTGKVSASPGLVHTETGWQRAPERRTNPVGAQGYTGQSGADVFRQRQQQQSGQLPGPGSGVSPAGNTGRALEPTPRGARPQYLPPTGQVESRPRQGFTPPGPGQQRPVYAPPQQQRMERPNYGPPPQRQMERPNYTPPPQMPRYSPPPPPMPHMAPPPPPASAPAARSPK